MDAAAATLLFRLIALGTRSLLQYVSESVPWSADSSHAALETVKSIAREERDEVDSLTRFLQKKRIRIPSAGSYPSHFTTTNYVAVDYVLPKLIAEDEKEIAEIERQLHPLNDEEARRLAEAYLAMKRRHLDALRNLSAA
jgi:hypothetical protein